MKMKFIFLVLLFVSLYSPVELNDTWLSLYKALFQRQSLTNCVPQTNDYCPLVNVLHGIFPSEGNKVDWDTLFDTIPDDETLEWIILLGLQQFALFASENPSSQLDDFDSLIHQLLNVANILAEQGSRYVKWSDLKPLVRRLILAIFPAHNR
jgi:hypothetical protein